MPAQYVIHTVGPKWRGGKRNEREELYSCYIESLKLAASKGCATVAFPLISAGDYGYPEEQALQVATDAISEFLTDSDMLVYIVIFMGCTKTDAKKSKVKNTLIVLLLIVLVVTLLALVFRDYISDFIRSIYSPIGPGGMIDPPLN